MSHRIVIVVIITVLATSAAATDVTVTYLGGLDNFPTIEFTTTADCIYGNTGQPGHILDASYFDLGPATSFDPLAFACPCDEGFIVEALHMVVAKMDDQPISETIRLAMGNGYLRNYWPPEQECFFPDPCDIFSYSYGQYCIGEALVSFGPAGFYEVVFSGNLGACDCIFTDYVHTIVSYQPYYLFNTALRLVTDVNPDHCPDHRGVIGMLGTCWWDLLDAPGDLAFWTEATCCATPVSTARVTWGTVKSLYR